MSDRDRIRWDEQYRGDAHASLEDPRLPAIFAPYEASFPTRGRALELACGRGAATIWLALRGLDVSGVDVSPEAIGAARDLADRCGVADRCQLDVVDLDNGLPAGPLLDVVLCHRFRDARLDAAVVERLAPNGILAIAVLSVVGHGPGRFRAAAGELLGAFASLTPLGSGEGAGSAWLVATKA